MDRKIRYFVITACLILCCSQVSAQTAESRCFQFTWLGPRWTNTSSFGNATCDGITNLASGVPCFRPLVVSHDGTWPDIEHIWTHHKENASCVLAANDVCAQFTYYFDDKVENSTYMCTRGVNAEGVAITSGCYEDRNGSYTKRVCLCRSTPGAIPCNNAMIVFANISLIAILLISLADQYMGKIWFY